MSSFAAELEYNRIISAEAAANIRSYIASRYPGLSPVRRAGIFADAINRIVDCRLPSFEPELVKRLKRLLFGDTTARPVFFIDCLDVFKAAIKLRVLNSEFLKQLNSWLSEALKKNVVKESLFDLVLNTHNLMDSMRDADVSEIISLAEETTGGLKYTGLYPEDIVVGESAAAVVSEESAEVPAACVPRKKYAGYKVILSYAAAAVIVVSILLSNTLVKSLSGMKPAGPGTNPISAGTPASAPDMMDFRTIGEMYRPAAGAGSMATARGLTQGRRMVATAYDLSVESCGKRPDHPAYGITSTGTRARVGRTVAVDPEVIPLGSRLYISFPPEYSHLDGVYIAEDTGRLIKGDKIDIFFGEDREGSREICNRAMEFGIRYVNVVVLD